MEKIQGVCTITCTREQINGKKGETWTVLNTNGDEVLFRRDNGYEKSAEYNERGQKIHEKQVSGKDIRESWLEYDSEGRIIRESNTSGFDQRTKYNDDDSCVKERTGCVEEIDSNGNKTHAKYPTSEEWTEYNSAGQETYYKSSADQKRWTEYDEQSRPIHAKMVSKKNSMEEWSVYFESLDLVKDEERALAEKMKDIAKSIKERAVEATPRFDPEKTLQEKEAEITRGGAKHDLASREI